MKSFKGCRNNVTGMPVFNNWSSNIRLDQLQSGVPFSMPCPSKRELPATSKRGKWGGIKHGCLPKHMEIRYSNRLKTQTVTVQGHSIIPKNNQTTTSRILWHLCNQRCQDRQMSFQLFAQPTSYYKHQMNIHPVVLLTKPTVPPGGDISAPHRRTQWYLSNSATVKMFPPKQPGDLMVNDETPQRLVLPRMVQWYDSVSDWKLSSLWLISS